MIELYTVTPMHVAMLHTRRPSQCIVGYIFTNFPSPDLAKRRVHLTGTAVQLGIVGDDAGGPTSVRVKIWFTLSTFLLLL